jgi:UDP-N-acetylglucosamine--N-acetylmuramyl-(pentapeptide) pyrophosphoryl-undecaprenol N-acetylglucosamine transferase
MPTKKICFTGGGTAGHVIPNLYLAKRLSDTYLCFYIGSSGMEQDLVKDVMPFYSIASGKLRRYVSLQNFLDIFKVALGYFQALWILGRERPSLVFSKGGYVAVPVCFAASTLRIPIITHESDASCGLATKLIARVASKVLCTFESACVFPHSVYVGALVREDIYQGDGQRGAAFLGIHDSNRKVLLVMGGSLGAETLNQLIIAHLDELCRRFFCGALNRQGKVICIATRRLYCLCIFGS